MSGTVKLQERMQEYEQRIRELEAENVRLLVAIKDAPCPDHDVRQADKSQCGCCDCQGPPCDCWKRAALEDQ